MERIRTAFITHRPKGVTFQASLEGDPIHVLHWMGQNPKEHTKRDEICMSVASLPLTKKYIVIAHIGNPHYRGLDAYYQKLLAEAILVITFDKRILGYEGSNVFETPWGFEPETFYWGPNIKRYKILSTGYMADPEGIDACWDACCKLHVKLCHVGGKFLAIPPMLWNERYEGIKDHKMRELYGASEYVNGMRREGGFELPVIEGYACGCQPVVFDQPTMKKYYSDFALFVPNVPRKKLAEHLVKVLSPKKNIKPDPEILKRFHWAPIMCDVWERLLKE